MMEGISISKRYYWKKIKTILIVLAFAATWFLLTLAITSNRNGNMTIYIDKTTATKTLSLSENSDLSNPAGKLYAPALVNAWDEIEDKIPEYSDLLDGDNSKFEGISYDEDQNPKNGITRERRNYIAYTFYLFNSGSEALDYYMYFDIEYVDKEIDSTLRVRLYENDQLVTYAKENELGEYDDYKTEPFESEDVIVHRDYENFAPGAENKKKYTVVIWVEANDKDTTNEKIGGSIVLSIRFGVKG